MRQAAICLLGAGFYVGLAGALLPLLAAHFTFSTTVAMRWQAALLGGTVLGAFAGRWLARLPSGIQAVKSAGVSRTLLSPRRLPHRRLTMRPPSSSACEAIGNHIYRLGTALANTPFADRGE